MLARRPQPLEEASDRVRRHCTRVLHRPADTTDDASVRASVDAVLEEFGGVDILVNSAATPTTPGPRRSFVDLPIDEFRSGVETKVLGYLRCARAVAPHMVTQGWGRIINISGLGARTTSSLFGSMRNVAVAAMTKNLADELGSSGVNVTVVHPGMTVTERTPTSYQQAAAISGETVEQVASRLGVGPSIGRLVTAEEVADVVVFLASPRSVAINGDAVAVGGGARGAIYY